MTRDSDRLQRASDILEDATETADEDVRDELRETADAFAEFSNGDHEADHAVLDQHLNTLRQVERRATDDETAGHVERALEHVEDYREDVDQA